MIRFILTAMMVLSAPALAETFNFTTDAPTSVTVGGSGPVAFRYFSVECHAAASQNSCGIYEVELHDANGKISTSIATISGAGRNTSWGDYPGAFDGSLSSPRLQSDDLGPDVEPAFAFHIDFGDDNGQAPTEIKIAPRNGDANAPYTGRVYGSNVSPTDPGRVLLAEWEGVSTGWADATLRAFPMESVGESGNVLDGITVTSVEGAPANVGQPVQGEDGTITINADGSYVYEPDGSGGGSGGGLCFNESLVSDNYDYAFASSLIEVNGETWIVSSDAGPDSTSNGHVYLQKIDGTRHTIRAGGWYERHDLHDMDGDGDEDIVIVQNNLGLVTWLENGGDATVTWTEHSVGSVAYAYNVAVADLDADGDPDVAATSWATGTVELFDNNGDGTFSKTTLASGLGKTRFIGIADMDGDSNLDIVAGGTSDIKMFAGPNWTASTIATISVAKNGSMHGNTAWIAGSSGIYSVTPSGATLEFNLSGGYDATRGDLDGDGKVETVATSRPGGGVFVFEEDGTRIDLKNPWEAVNQPTIGDANGDGSLDVIASADGSVDEMRAWQLCSAP